MGHRTITPDADDPIDRAVLEFQRGSRPEENFEVIHRRFYKPVKAFLVKRGIPLEECDDLNNEIFLKIYLSMEAFAWRSTFATWLFTIAVNEYRNWRGRQSRRQSLLLPSGDPGGSSGAEEEPPEREVEDDSESPRDRQLRKERVQLLRRAIEELSPKQRECLKLRLLELSYQEIADLMGVAIGTVKALLSQAREALRNKLGDYFGDIDF